MNRFACEHPSATLGLLLAVLAWGGWASPGWSQPADRLELRAGPAEGTPSPSDYSVCESCGICHVSAYREHSQSMHSLAFSNPVFLAQYERDVLPGASRHAEGFRLARSCTACHAPVAHRRARARVVLPDPARARESGVTCDFCHTIKDFRGAEAGNANYECAPGLLKFGPFETKTGWHHQYSPLQTKSEFCAICHSVRNAHGLDVKSTYAEWKESRHARLGIECQDCHMSVDGFLTEGRPQHRSGRAAVMGLGSAPLRETLYTHRFQGARTRSQIEGAIQLAIQAPAEPPQAGGDWAFTVLVDNSRTGHKMPSGSVELRYLWLDVCAEIDGRRIPLCPQASPDSQGYDVAGPCVSTEGRPLTGAVPPGRRVYRTLLEDDRGEVTLAFYAARRIRFDNRLNAAEVRPEIYCLSVPPAQAPRVTLIARLYYVAYPDVFAERLHLPKYVPVEIASTRAEFAMRAE